MRRLSFSCFWYPLLLFGLALAARYVFFRYFGNEFSHEGESYSKINLVRVWLDQGKPYPDPNFGPLHTWLIYLLVRIGGDWILPVRVFGLLVGSLTVPIYYFFLRAATDERTAILAALLFALFPTHLRASPTGLAEVPYLFFFVGGLWMYFLAWNRRDRRTWVYFSLAALGWTAAGMLRFEAWLYYPVLCLALLGRRRIGEAFGFGAMLAVFPLIHMGISWHDFGNPTNFAATSASSFLQYMPDMPWADKAFGWFYSLELGMGWPAAILAAAGLVSALIRRRFLLPAALLIFPLALLEYKAISNTLDPSLERYIVGLAALLYAFAGFALSSFGEHLQRIRTPLRHAVTVALAAILVFQVVHAWNEAVENRYPADVRQVVDWLRRYTGPADRVLPDQRFHPYVELESRLPIGAFVNLQWRPDRKALDPQAFALLLAETPPTIVIFDYLLADTPYVNSNLDVFPVPRDAPEYEQYGLRLTKVFAAGDFVIYRSTKKEADS
ncbi:MAG: glycosyltransferase family 39 protein [Myxococcales bacterium]|nr:glycosyltransferase family 39 protein [Myxococcales bacterium]